MRPNPACWLEIYVQDMPRARGFYEGLLGVTLERLNNPEIELWAFPADRDRFGISGALVRMPGMPSGGNSTLVYFSCEDCAVEAARVGALGGRVEKPKFAIGEYGYICLACDPDGNMFGLHSLQ